MASSKKIFTGSTGPLTRAVNAESVPELIEKLRRAAGASADETRSWGTNHLSIEIDRYGRHDHGGGPYGDDWLDEGQVEDQYHQAKKEHGAKIEAVRRVLRSEGYSDETGEFDIGEKGHVSIEIHLEKIVETDVIKMRQAALDPSCKSSQLAAMSEEDDEVLLARIASHPRTGKAQLAALAKKGGPLVKRALAVNENTPNAVLAELAESEDIKILWRLAANPSTGKAVIKNLVRLAKHGGKEEIALALLSNSKLDESDLVLLLKPAFLQGLSQKLKDLPDLPAKSVAELTSAVLKSGANDVRREFLAAHPNQSIANLRLLLSQAGSNQFVLTALAQNPVSDESVLREVVSKLPGDNYDRGQVLRALAKNKNTPKDVMDNLFKSRLEKDFLDQGDLSLGYLMHSGAADLLSAIREAEMALFPKYGAAPSGPEKTRLAKVILAAEKKLEAQIPSLPKACLYSLVKDKVTTDKALFAILSQIGERDSYNRDKRANELSTAISAISLHPKASDATVGAAMRLARKNVGITTGKEVISRFISGAEMSEFLNKLRGVKRMTQAFKDQVVEILKNLPDDVYMSIVKRDDLPDGVMEFLYEAAKGTAKNLTAVHYSMANNLATPLELLERLAEAEPYYPPCNISESSNGAYYHRTITNGRTAIICAVAGNKNCPKSVLTHLSKMSSEDILYAVAGNKSTPREILKTLVDDRREYIRRAAAETLGR